MREAAYRRAPEAGANLCRFLPDFLREAGYPPGRTLSAYWPLPGEFDLRQLLGRLHELGYDIVLPVVIARGKPLIFRAWQPGLRLEEGAFRTLAPGPDSPERRPDILIVPLLAFDRRGYRLGYGGGFYDRTLEAFRKQGPVLAIGAAYEAQACPDLPIDSFDQPLDAIATENGIRVFTGNAKREGVGR